MGEAGDVSSQARDDIVTTSGRQIGDRDAGHAVPELHHHLVDVGAFRTGLDPKPGVPEVPNTDVPGEPWHVESLNAIAGDTIEELCGSNRSPAPHFRASTR